MSKYYLVHHGIKGMKWGVRRFQNEDGTLTTAGKKRYSDHPIVPDHGSAKASKLYPGVKGWRKPFDTTIKTVRTYQSNRNAKWDKAFNALSLDKADFKNRASDCTNRANYYRSAGDAYQAEYYDGLAEKWEREYEKADEKMKYLYQIKGAYWVEDKILTKYVTTSIKAMRSDSFIAKSMTAIDKGKSFVKKLSAKIFGPKKSQSGIRK